MTVKQVSVDAAGSFGTRMFLQAAGFSAAICTKIESCVSTSSAALVAVMGLEKVEEGVGGQVVFSLVVVSWKR